MLSNKLKDARCFKSKESTDPSSPLMEVLCSPSKCQWCRCIAIDAPYSKCLCICMIMQLYKECGETDVPIIVVKGLFSHPGDVALNEYFILTFFNTIAGLSLTHCYLWGMEFTKWDKLVCLWLGTKWVMMADCLREPTWLGKYSGSIRDLNNISYFITQNVLLDL